MKLPAAIAIAHTLDRGLGFYLLPPVSTKTYQCNVLVLFLRVGFGALDRGVQQLAAHFRQAVYIHQHFKLDAHFGFARRLDADATRTVVAVENSRDALHLKSLKT